jgi:hypothetical protein
MQETCLFPSLLKTNNVLYCDCFLIFNVFNLTCPQKHEKEDPGHVSSRLLSRDNAPSAKRADRPISSCRAQDSLKFTDQSAAAASHINPSTIPLSLWKGRRHRSCFTTAHHYEASIWLDHFCHQHWKILSEKKRKHKNGLI